MSDDQDRLRDALHEAADSVELPLIDWTPRLAALRAKRQRARKSAMAGVLAVTAIVAGVAVARSGIGGRDSRSGGFASGPETTPIAPPSANEGTAMASYGYASAEPSWYELQSPPLEVRSGMTAAWTGSEYVLWGGGPAGTAGAAYDPLSAGWRKITEPSLAGRSDAITAWTGSKLIVWGGVAIDDDAAAPLDDGALYDPVADQWYPMEPLPGGGRAASTTAAVWADGELLVWGGGIGANDGAAYDPETNSWRPLPSAQVEWRESPAGVWTGTQFVVWGGSRVVDGTFANLGDGAAYTPATDTWTVLSPAPMAPAVVDAAWTGTAVAFTPGYSGDPNGTPFANDSGGIYDPATGNWQKSAFGLQHPGAEVIAVDDQVVTIAKGHAVLHDPTTGTITDVADALAMDGSTGAIDGSTAVWTGSEVLALDFDGRLFGLAVSGVAVPMSCVASESSAAIDAQATAGGESAPTDAAEPVPAPPTIEALPTTAPQPVVEPVPTGIEPTASQDPLDAATLEPPIEVTTVPGWDVVPLALGNRTGTATAWTGEEYVIWGGTDGIGVFSDGIVVDPATGDVREMRAAPIDGRTGAIAEWTGTEVLIAGGAAGPDLSEPLTSQPAAAYNPDTNEWRLIPRSDVQLDILSGADAATTAWTGTELYALQGPNGAVLDEATGDWLTLPALPTGNVAAAAWDGHDVVVVATATGSPAVVYAYEQPAAPPANDDMVESAGGSWREVSTAPVAIDAPVATWTDDGLLLAGGGDPAGTSWGSVAFDPATGEWTELAQTPYHPGAELVWTGSEAMFVMKGGAGLIDPSTGAVTETPAPAWLQAGTGRGTGDGAVYVGEVANGDCSTTLVVARYRP